ncbi:hypothetical protein GOBAR_AA30397 [Gossypium barbadense]|uniref:Uncharacterized protein n=1 Tax=Gossypium barbadense TaxID=3634 RepID=A0A2P5WGW3_GOSBA|nr:hypothetical protein GOBAR_AA30397 [Gossypium barbadense]
MLSREWVVKVGHIYQEENQATDFIARIATLHNWGFVMIQNSSMGMLQVLREDRDHPTITTTVPIRGEPSREA